MMKISSVNTAILFGALGYALAQSGSTTAAGSTSAPSSSGGSSADPADDCKLDNDFKYEVCGTDDGYYNAGGSSTKGKTCCSTKQACVGPVKVKSGDTDIDMYECSAARHLEGMKVLKIIMIPLIFIPLLVVFAIIMIVKCNIKGNHLTKAGVVLICFTWPLILSQEWWHGVWTAFLALLVSFISSCSGVPKWIYRLAWAMQIFQVVLLLGPTEAFHVPIFNQSLAGSSTKLIHKAFGLSLDANEASCNTFYESFMQKTAIEQSEKESNPDIKYGGLCAIGWLAFIQFCLIVQVVILIAMVLLSAPTFLDGTLGKNGASAADSTKVISVVPKAADDSMDKVA